MRLMHKTYDAKARYQSSCVTNPIDRHHANRQTTLSQTQQNRQNVLIQPEQFLRFAVATHRVDLAAGCFKQLVVHFTCSATQRHNHKMLVCFRQLNNRFFIDCNDNK